MKKAIVSLLLILTLTLGAISFGAAEEHYDIDLLGMSDTIVYSQILNILADKDAYVGKTIRYKGWFDYQEGSETTYFYAQVPDLAGCCYKGLEFIWAGDHKFPSEYPDYATDIVIAGKMETYDENGNIFMHVVDAEVTW